ncbi:MAG: hypothetical protein QXF55_02340 [Candidatus Aenigmatarchaeota archaeon]
MDPKVGAKLKKEIMATFDRWKKEEEERWARLTPEQRKAELELQKKLKEMDKESSRRRKIEEELEKRLSPEERALREAVVGIKGKL